MCVECVLTFSARSLDVKISWKDRNDRNKSFKDLDLFTGKKEIDILYDISIMVGCRCTWICLKLLNFSLKKKKLHLIASDAQ